MGPFVLAAIAAAVGWGIYKVATGGLSDAKWVIKVSGAGPEGVTIKGSVPGKSDGDVREFIGGLQLAPGVKIFGVPDGRDMRLRFGGDIPANLQQRVRNFFMN